MRGNRSAISDFTILASSFLIIFLNNHLLDAPRDDEKREICISNQFITNNSLYTSDRELQLALPNEPDMCSRMMINRVTN